MDARPPRFAFALQEGRKNGIIADLEID